MATPVVGGDLRRGRRACPRGPRDVPAVLVRPRAAGTPLDASVVNGRIAIDGRERTYTAVIPRDLPASAPLLFIFHGSNQGSEGSRVATGYGFDRLAEREGFVVVYPEGARSLMAAENLNFAKLAYYATLLARGWLLPASADPPRGATLLFRI